MGMERGLLSLISNYGFWRKIVSTLAISYFFSFCSHCKSVFININESHSIFNSMLTWHIIYEGSMKNFPSLSGRKSSFCLPTEFCHEWGWKMWERIMRLCWSFQRLSLFYKNVYMSFLYNFWSYPKLLWFK